MSVSLVDTFCTVQFRGWSGQANLYFFRSGDSTAETVRDFNDETTPGLRHRRLVGGNTTSIEDHPYQVSLELMGVHVCGGTIVSEDWILTAAHCFRYSWTNVMIRAGTRTVMNGGSLHQVVNIVIYDKHTQCGSQTADIALVQISPPLRLDKTRRKVELPHSRYDTLKAGDITNVTGWGLTEHGPTGDLYVFELPIFDRIICEDLYLSLVGGLVEGQICAGYYGENGKGACAADGGGPLVSGEKIYGIVSWGRSCASPYYPGVYTDVAYYADWIRERIKSPRKPKKFLPNNDIYNTNRDHEVADVAINFQLI
ncbi:hypothetical protein QAD02_015872 [Eretmocerus hayati]|uniref:Uncharacterized protein n=1 Tax=Eretmocerus hayati TaxID=131215 RepID=A0ACC2PE89_9HYME|nr:hypothetical protein QAD02_015872 [Eretmocerus hayati]